MLISATTSLEQRSTEEAKVRLKYFKYQKRLPPLAECIQSESEDTSNLRELSTDMLHEARTSMERLDEYKDSL